MQSPTTNVLDPIGRLVNPNPPINFASGSSPSAE
jgi:hypothetical protein